MHLNKKMVSLDDAIIARLKTHGETFEIWVDPDLALRYKEGEDIDLKELLAIDNVFKDAKGGEKASEKLIKDIFGSDDIETVADRILKKGEIHLTTEQKRQMLEEKRKAVVALIAKNAINPQTRTPHPPARIENAMNEAKVNIELYKSAQRQVDVVLKAIRPILPISFESIKMAIKIPSSYVGASRALLHGFGKTEKEEWGSGGELMMLMVIPAGLQDELYNKLNNATHGEVQIKILR